MVVDTRNLNMSLEGLVSEALEERIATLLERIAFVRACIDSNEKIEAYYTKFLACCRWKINQPQLEFFHQDYLRDIELCKSNLEDSKSNLTVLRTTLNEHLQNLNRLVSQAIWPTPRIN